MSRLGLLKWPLALAVVVGLLALAYLVHGEMQRRRAAEGEAEKGQAPRRVENRVIKLGAALARAHGLEDEPAQAVQWYERVAVPGRVVPNPRATAEVRAPFAGTLRAEAGAPWPAPGQPVRAGQVLGRLDVRVGPQERLDLQAKATEARARQQGAEDVQKIQQERVDRLRKLAGSQTVAQRELDEAQVQLAEAQTQAAVARAAAELWQQALDDAKKGSGVFSSPLIVPADGEVTELAGRPGVAVEAGALLAQVVDFRRQLVRLDLPAEVLAAGPPAEVDLFAPAAAPPALRGAGNRPQPGEESRPVKAALVGPAPQVDPAVQAAGYWYEVRDDSAHAGPAAAWRPGLFVQAFVKVPGAPPREAVAVPATALLYHQGRALVYVRVDPGKYARREVEVLGREGDRCTLAARLGLAPAGVAPGEAVVARQAQVLLSEEFRIDVDED
jgi:multidrug efflux pump subunit AcrA (membrane-fusion protein)